MKRFILIALFLLLPLTTQAAQLIEYVDPDASGAANGDTWTDAYTSLNAWEAAEGQDLTDGGGDYMTVYCRSSSGGDDTTPVIINGFTTAAGNYVEIIGSDFPSDGVWDDTKYQHHCTNSSSLININVGDSFVYLRNLQIHLNMTGATAAISSAIYFPVDDGWVDSCHIRGTSSGTGSGRAIYTYNGDRIWVYNTIMRDFISGADTGFVGIRQYAATDDDFYVYNCVIYNCGRGLSEENRGNMDSKNNAIGSCNDDVYEVGVTFTMDYMVTDDDHSGDCANYHDFPTNGTGDWSLDFATPGTDFDLLATAANLIDDGVSDPSSGEYSDDIIGTARGASWDIGAYELAGAPPAARRIFTSQPQ